MGQHAAALHRAAIMFRTTLTGRTAEEVEREAGQGKEVGKNSLKKKEVVGGTGSLVSFSPSIPCIRGKVRSPKRKH